MHRLRLLSDIGVTADFEPLKPIIDIILESFGSRNTPTINILIPKVFRGTGQVEKTWIICDYPQILYSLLKMGVKNGRTTASLEYLA
jgi:hypothetical protein